MLKWGGGEKEKGGLSGVCGRGRDISRGGESRTQLGDVLGQDLKASRSLETEE